jgi:tetratricopeptide (TPR) repeat protein
LLTAPSLAFAADTVRVRRAEGQENLRGRITRLNPKEITIDVKGAEDVVSVGNVVSVRFDDEPQELADARLRIRSGDFLEAIQLLKEIDVTKLDDTDQPIKQDIQFYFAFCMAQRALGGAESLKDAAGLMVKFVKSNADSYHYYEANEIVGDLAAEMGRPDDAEKFYNIAAEAPWPEAKLRMAVARARNYQMQNKHEQAISDFDKVLSSGMQSELADRMRLAAKLGKAASLARTKQGEAGINLCYDVIKSAEQDDTEIHARAYNALGDCYMALGQYKAAAIAYLHVDTMYYQHPPLHAESLARLASVWDRLEMPDRAASARKKLNSTYPNSKWAKQSS